MLENLTLLTLASDKARHAAVRHRTIAENIANANTPGYRARDVQDFRAVVEGAVAPWATRPGHVGYDPRTAEPPTHELALPASPNGNTVNLEDQAVRAVEAQGEHALALSVYQKSIALLRLGLGRGR